MLDVARRFAESPSWADTVSVLGACTRCAVTAADVLAMGFADAVDVAAELVSTVFDPRALKQRAKAKESERHEADDGRIAADRMTGTAVAIWGIAPSEAWQMTVPEWWDAATVQIEANAPKDGVGWAEASESVRAAARELADAMPDVIRPDEDGTP